MQETVATLSNLVDRGILVPSEDFIVEKLPDGRSRLEATPQAIQKLQAAVGGAGGRSGGGNNPGGGGTPYKLAVDFTIIADYGDTHVNSSGTLDLQFYPGVLFLAPNGRTSGYLGSGAYCNVYNNIVSFNIPPIPNVFAGAAWWATMYYDPTNDGWVATGNIRFVSPPQTTGISSDPLGTSDLETLGTIDLLNDGDGSIIPFLHFTLAFRRI